MNALKQKIYISGPISGLPEPKVSFSFRETERDLRIMEECNAVYFMDGWENSLGCQVEHARAVELLIDRYYQSPLKRSSVRGAERRFE